ncbi:MAG: 4Fe-4S dicluster domain-containing protein [Phycisphaerae bacterium]|nr:4Fe-4S dicluster domain-containing protein [Phycisphaerae bacterium]
MKITTVRIISQIVFMGLFLMFVFVTTFTHLDDAPALKFWVSKYLEIDPLIAIATSLATHTLYQGLIWSLVILIPTLLLGRLFCNWICPFGILHHFVGWIFNRRSTPGRIASNRYRPMYQTKYYVLAAMLAAAVFGSLQIGLLDPICLLHRSLTVSVLPALNMPPVFVEIFGNPKLHQLGWVVGGIALFLVGMNLVIPRFFCRTLCPLGALLGAASRFSLWRIDRDPNRCTECGLCDRNCEGACDPGGKLRKSECFVCFNCIDSCPHGALRFAFLPARIGEVAWPDASRRRAILAVVAGVIFYPFTKLAGKTTRDFSSKAIRPPGSVEEQEFLARCLKCGQCIRVCPTNVLQPAMLETGLEGMWTPVMNFRMGFCQLNCTACGHVCPTGAIQRLTVEQKQGLGRFASAGPIRLGTAHYDLGRCLPWSKNIPCVVCEEVCPTSPKAIHTEQRLLLVRDGKKMVVLATPVTVTISEYPPEGQSVGQRCVLPPNAYRGDPTAGYYVQLFHRDGTSETHRIIANDVDTLMIGELDPAGGQLLNGSRFAQIPERGDVAAILIELKVPKIDTELCIGCGLCEYHCPVVGDRRPVYVTAEGETRSEGQADEARNRSFRLVK